MIEQDEGFIRSGHGAVPTIIDPEALVADARRYRWIRETKMASEVEHALHRTHGTEFDAAIDRLMELDARDAADGEAK